MTKREKDQVKVEEELCELVDGELEAAVAGSVLPGDRRVEITAQQWERMYAAGLFGG